MKPHGLGFRVPGLRFRGPRAGRALSERATEP